METRQLSYFILACQFKNHTEAAARSGLSPSVLSENLGLLGQELGLGLFQRGPLGNYPTDEARWLYQAVEPILQIAEIAETVLRLTDAGPTGWLEVTSPLQFMVGRLSRSASLALRALRHLHPAILATARFADSGSQVPGADPARGPVQGPPVGRVVLDYAAGEADESRDAALFSDEWLCVMPADLPGGETLSFEALRALPLYLPALSPEQIRRGRAYCAAHDLPEPKIVEDDIGTFLGETRGIGGFGLLAPQSLVEGSLAHHNLGRSALPVRLASDVVARIETDHPAARSYVTLLQDIVQGPEPVVIYEPKVTLKQMRHFLVLCEHLNVTAAARALNVVQPALSNQLRKLEAAVGQALFTRQRTGLTPTAGTPGLARLVTLAVERADHITARSAHQAADRQRRLAIGFIPMINHDGPLVRAISAALEDWTGRYPNVLLRLQEAPTQTLHLWVESGAISFALVEARVSRSSQIDLNTRDTFGVVSQAGAALLPPGDIPLRRLAELPLVLPGEGYGLRRILDRAAGDVGMRLVPEMEVNSLTMTLGLVRRMALATVLPRPSVQPYVDAGVFQFNPIVEPPVSRRLSILFSPSRSLTEIERSLVAVLRQHLAEAGFTAGADR